MSGNALFGDVATRAVTRAAHDLRCGWPVVVALGGSRAMVTAAEFATSALSGESAAAGLGMPRLALTREQARRWNLQDAGSYTPCFSLAADALTALPRHLADPDGPSAPVVSPSDDVGPELADAAVELCRIAELLPAALVWQLRPGTTGLAATAALAIANANDVIAHRARIERGLEPLVEVPLPLEAAPDARIVAIRQVDAPVLHLAILIGDVGGDDAPLCRLHSACFTGDLLGSLRCDCGEQLRGSLARMHAEGSGVLLYLAHEGRGIGLMNKLRAYRLQDRGLDTLEANRALGFADDERRYADAARMLAVLGVRRVRLLSNNPAKVRGLEAHGLVVTERLTHAFAANRHNRAYLATKAAAGGHDLGSIADSLETARHAIPDD